MKTIHVEVTQEDIEHGKRIDCRECPIARALERATGRTCSVGVYRGHVGDSEIRLPHEATAFVQRFDMRREVSPISFDIEVDL